MSTRRTSPKDSLPAKSDEKPFLDLAAIDERALAETAKKILADVKREREKPPFLSGETPRRTKNTRLC